jgi:hypothetical protein
MVKTMTSYLKLSQKGKGFALIQVLLAVALGAVVAAGVAYYYSRTAKDQVYDSVTANIISTAEISQEENVIGSPSASSYTQNGYNVAISGGTATISSIDLSACNAIASQLKSKGVVTASCNSNNASQNTITFSPVDTSAVNQAEQTFVAGTPDNTVNTSVNNANLSGTFSASGSNVASGSTASVFTSSGSTLPANTGLSGGGSGGLGSGSAASSPTSSAPTSSTGTTSLACSYYLTQPAYQTTSLGTRATPCASGYTSTSNQTGTETFACANPSSATLPVGTDTWTGGSCAIICVPASPEYQNIACPTGDYGTEEQEATSSCPNYTGSPVYGPWVTISTSNCHADCAPPATTVTYQYSSATEDPGCPAGDIGSYTYVEQTKNTQTTTWSCASVSATPTSTVTNSGYALDGDILSSSDTCTPATPSYTSEQVCSDIGNRVPAGCASGAGTTVFASSEDYTGGSFQVTISYAGSSATETVYTTYTTSQTFSVGGGSFTVTANASVADNCPAANPAFAGECIDRVSGTVTQN